MKNPRFLPDKNQGFALIATILLMVLLAIITVGTLSLSVVTIRTSGQNSAQNIARANARMALMIAIGELQRHTGSDTRVTAPANLVDETYPQVLGVWRSWEGTDHEASGTPGQGRPIAPVYTAKDTPESSGGRFIDWLVSSAPSDTTPAITDAPTLVRTTPTTDTIPLLANGSLQATDTRQVHLVPTKVDDDGDNVYDGRLAWWVSGENQKALLAQPYQPRNEDVSALAEMGQSHTIADPTVFGLPALLNDPELHNPSTAPAKIARKAISRQTMFLLDEKNTTEPHKKFHDLSSYSIGLLTNTATGGWRKDLSILTEKWDDIYASYPGRQLPLFRYTPTTGSTATTLVPKPTVTNYKPAQSNLYPWSNYSVILGNEAPYTLHAAAASWASLVSYATSYKNFTNNSGTFESPFLWDVISDRGRTLTGQKMYNYKHTQRLYPQIARFQMLVYARAVERTPVTNPKRYNLRLLYAPVFTLWNPYNVRLSIDNPGAPISSIVMGYRRSLPGALAIVPQASYPNPSNVPSTQYTMFNPGNLQYQDYWANTGVASLEDRLPENVARFKLAGPGICAAYFGGASNTFGGNLPKGKITFEPGEAIMFSSDGNMTAGFGGAIGYGLKEGYDPSTVYGVENSAGYNNLTAATRYWFLLRTDKYTKPFRNLAPGIGFSLSYGIETGTPYLGLPLYTGLDKEYHNLTSITDGALADKYWPNTELDEVGYSIAELASGPWIPLFSINLGPRMTIGTPPGTPQNRPTKGVIQSDPK